VLGHEQAGRRPVLVVSADAFNSSPRELVVIVPLTSRSRAGAFRVGLEPPEGGLRTPSVILVDQVRTASLSRLVARWGEVTGETMATVERGLRALLVL
jgi:mRNA interferase MazF